MSPEDLFTKGRHYFWVRLYVENTTGEESTSEETTVAVCGFYEKTHEYSFGKQLL
jgi:hypothetical protein